MIAAEFWAPRRTARGAVFGARKLRDNQEDDEQPHFGWLTTAAACQLLLPLADCCCRSRNYELLFARLGAARDYERAARTRV